MLALGLEESQLSYRQENDTSIQLPVVGLPAVK